jgi:hypothetical protein
MLEQTPRLSKSRFLSGLQCQKRLYLEDHAPELADAADPYRRSILEAGSRVGALARRCYPGGVLIEEDHLRHDEAVLRTRALLGDPAVPAIYEAAFTWDGIRIRADVLVRVAEDVFDLVEVKSSAGAKPEHEWDVAVQLAVLRGSGVSIRRAGLLHLGRGYVYGGGEYDLDRLFSFADMTGAAQAKQPEVLAVLAAMRTVLRREASPSVPVGAHCESPHWCPFFGHCHRGLPADPFAGLPRASERLRMELAEAGIGASADIPHDFPGLSALQVRALAALRSGERFCDPEIREILGALERPIHFLDFETVMPALPLYAGTRPYDTIPFQWSDHVLHDDGRLEHREYLDAGAGDPRARFAETLLDSLGERGAIVVYSGYEEARLGDLAGWLPELRARIEAVRPRLFDLLGAVRRHVYDTGFNGSFSLKSVLPALVPSLGYDDLAIGNGGLASLAFAEIQEASTAPERRSELRDQLRAYCARDTLALVELVRLLQ